MMIEEVHLWRGTPEERALRSQLVKSTQFAYFDEQLDHPDWCGKSVLDFGGNKGNLLRDPACVIAPENYYCLDVIREAIDEGRASFPDAHWIHYDRYNRSFNPEGARDLPVPDFGLRLDFILSYSVFTHTTFEEMKELVAQLEGLLAPGGALAFTFIDPHWRANLEWRVRRGTGLVVEAESRAAGVIAEASNAEWCALVNGRELYVNSSGPWNLGADECATYNVYYSESFFRREFPRAEIRRPVNGERQHCAILRKDLK
jgi:SAM-dependent methyltransferase